MTTLDLIEVIDENFRVYPTFFSLDPFLKKVGYPKLRIFGFNKELLYVSSKGWKEVFLPKPKNRNELSEEIFFLNDYREAIQKNILNKLNSRYKTKVSSYSSLLKDLDRAQKLCFELESKAKNKFEELKMAKYDNSLLEKFSEGHAHLFNNILHSSVKYVYSQEADRIVSDYKSGQEKKSFSIRDFGDYLFEVYEKMELDININ